MQNNIDVIKSFYTAFRDKNFKVMQSLYRDDATFADPVFGQLNASEVKAMWEMLLSSSKDLRIEFSDAKADASAGSCHWEAWYTFSKTNRPVHNIIDASFEFRDGKIFKHTDRFDLWRWSRQALGVSGLLLGWTAGVQNKIKTTARGRLNSFMSK
jgi:hypothetical protein